MLSSYVEIKFTLTQIPQPIQSSSEMNAIFESVATSIHNLPIRTTGQDFLHSWRHFFGLHLSVLTIAILVRASCSFWSLLFIFFRLLILVAFSLYSFLFCCCLISLYIHGSIMHTLAMLDFSLFFCENKNLYIYI